MKRKWKIILGILIIFFILIGSLVILFLNEARFYKNAEDLSPFAFGSEKFNSKLSNCGISYSFDIIGVMGIERFSWEIRGLKNNNCKVIFVIIDENSPFLRCIDNGGSYCENELLYNKVYSCYLPSSLYTDPEEINWTNLFNNENYCEIYVNKNVENYQVEENTEPRETKNISIKETKEGYIYETMLEDGMTFVWCNNYECPENYQCKVDGKGYYFCRKECSQDSNCPENQFCVESKGICDWGNKDYSDYF